jgi:hypothetical protein
MLLTRGPDTTSSGVATATATAAAAAAVVLDVDPAPSLLLPDVLLFFDLLLVDALLLPVLAERPLKLAAAMVTPVTAALSSQTW